MSFKLQQQYASVCPPTCARTKEIRARPKKPPPDRSSSCPSAGSPPRTPPPNSTSPHPTSVLRLPFLCLHLLPQGRSFRDGWLTGSVTGRSAASGIRPPPLSARGPRQSKHRRGPWLPTNGSRSCVCGWIVLSVHSSQVLFNQPGHL